MKSAARILGMTACVALVGLLIAGCGGQKTVTPIAVGEMQEYRDPQYGFRLRFPLGWTNQSEAGKTRIYSSDETVQRFVDPTGAYADGVIIAVDVTKTPAPDQQKATLISEMKASGRVLAQEVASTMGGKPAATVGYTASWSKQVKEQGVHIYVPLDTLLFDITLAGFGDQYAAHSLIFDAITKSFEFAKPVEKGRDETLPSENFTNYDTKLFSFQYPENFNFVDVSKGTNDMALGLRGVRQDCSILFHVFGAKGLTVDKVVAQNKGKYPGAASGKATVGGLPAVTLTYAPTREVERRFYFAVKDDKVYRVTMDWYKPQRQQYLATYDKVIQSIKFK